MSYTIDWTTTRIQATDFFTTVNSGFSIGECHIYKLGNIINIQRLVVNNSSTLSVNAQVDVGTINSKYRPLSGSYVKTACDRASTSASSNTVLTVNLNGSNGILRVSNTSGTSYTGNYYMHNIMYFCKES